jgi:hypothetical protein
LITAYAKVPCLLWTNEKIGILETPPAKKDYWKDPMSLLELVKKYYKREPK